MAMPESAMERSVVWVSDVHSSVNVYWELGPNERLKFE